MAVTIYEVAKSAGVSISTVSRVMNERGRVSKETEERVLRAIKDLDFHPNINASGLAWQKTNIIGSLVFGFGDQTIPEMFALEFLTGMQEVCSKEHYNLLMITNYEECIKLLKTKRMDGLIVHSSQDSLELRDYISSVKFPTVYVGESLEDNAHLDICDSTESYLRAGLKAFQQEGRTEVCTLIFAETEEKKQLLIELIVRLSIELGMNSEGIKHPDRLILNGADDTEGVWLRLSELMKAGVRAFFTDSIYFAQQVIDATHHAHLSIPQDVSVLCIEHEEGQGDWMHPAISALYMPAKEMGVTSLEFLLRKIAGEETDSITFPPRYINRHSI